jgi:hypothetical protein
VNDPVSLSELAAATGLSRITIRRYLDAGRFPRAFRDPDAGTPSPWRVPLSDVKAAGLIAVTQGLSQPQTRPGRDDRDPGAEMLRVELAAARRLADERLDRIRHLEALSLRLVEALAARQLPSDAAPPT